MGLLGYIIIVLIAFALGCGLGYAFAYDCFMERFAKGFYLTSDDSLYIIKKADAKEILNIKKFEI